MGRVENGSSRNKAEIKSHLPLLKSGVESDVEN